MAEAHRTRAPYRNLPPEIAPPTVADAYAAQEALRELWTPIYGPVRGLKIATTTKVMQELMGIDHPCGGMIYERRIHQSPAQVRREDFVNLMVEFELAVRLGTSLPPKGAPYTPPKSGLPWPRSCRAFELIEDRGADYKSTSALSLIADNAWNGGVVLGAPQKVPADLELNGLQGRLVVNEKDRGSGLTDNPMGALAWLANLAVERGRPLEAGMIVITGSVLPTISVAPGERLVFSIEGLGDAELSIS